MKNKKMLLGMLVMVLAFGMSVVGCERESGGTFTLTNIPSEFNGMYAALFAESGRVELIGAQRVVFSRWEETIVSSRISGGRVRIPMWIFNERTEELMRYNGNHTVEVEIIITSSATGEGELAVVYFDSVAFRNGSATRSWRDADEVERW